ncbi:MAG: solute carrier family 12 (sodium/potassium/chloride transporter), er 2 [Methanolobus sp.]|uniref:Amino acid transporter n=1 Tax=Methanolobus tindarius DSM 2278 TaxID=1090322 RepID=W9DNA6_METTI|nr:MULTISPECIES: amino acid permease [Methanolobus]ETA67494.1 amino acid transporter [Methanolobus tindarius DSM 2278]MDI3485898.1 solute carrier family 12 (sodium/potassium/chloride transporter), er 2 [Methanolobus sp.]MDK2832427.1 solute carrier family 12 (sodium/potassium/chloride transporter), er 2 [Methanolobus sp.]
MMSENTDEPKEKNLQEKVEEQKGQVPGKKLFGTVEGVFIPTLLTILGVIMYLREGWVIGNAGLLGAWLIILIAFGITLSTALSLSSITTNIRIGAGGAFSIISQSLGLEVGGSIGIPLYISQSLAVAMYIFGFRAGWLWMFPDHSPIVVDFAAFALLFIIAYISASLAFRIQYVILAIIISSLVSILWAASSGSMQEPITWWGSFSGSPESGFAGIGFWGVFAVFFPAATGIMAGANMSGELKNPRKSIPVGTLAAIVLSLVIYLLIAYWLARSASTDELLNNYTIMAEKAAWAQLIVAGLLGATFSSALSSIVGAPRILQALAKHQILPASDWFGKSSGSGEPRNAMIFTGAIVFLALLLRDLNAIAPLITMFFLITYAMINIVVLIEQNLKLISFRPLFKIPMLVSIIGAIGCVFVMVIVNPTFTILAFMVVLVIHAYLLKKHLKAPFGDVRSGLFVAVAEWAAKQSNRIAPSNERTWKANLLIPVRNPNILTGAFNIIKDITYPKGSVKLLGLLGEVEESDLNSRLIDLTNSFRKRGVFSSWTLIDTKEFDKSLIAGMEALTGSFFRPRVLFIHMNSFEGRETKLRDVIQKASKRNIGVLLLAVHPETVYGRQNSINLWINDRSPDWDISMDLGNQDLAILIAYKLKKNWKASLKMISCVKEQYNNYKAEQYLENLSELARIPNVSTKILLGDIESSTGNAPQASINVFSMEPDVDFDFVRKTVEDTGSSCLFALDSGEENALA